MIVIILGLPLRFFFLFSLSIFLFRPLGIDNFSLYITLNNVYKWRKSSSIETEADTVNND